MWLSEFVVGVVSCLLAEFILVLGVAIVGFIRTKGKKKEKEE